MYGGAKEEAAGGAAEVEGRATGIGHFFGALRIDGFRDPAAFKRTMDTWIHTFRAAEPVDAARSVMVPGDPEWAATEARERDGVPVKLAVLADLLDVARACALPPPFDEGAVELRGVKRATVLSC